MASAIVVTGELAASTIMRAAMSLALSSVMTPPRAAGMRMSQSSFSSSSLLILSPLPKPSIERRAAA